MTLDPRTPVVVGVGQLSHRVDRGEEPLEPVELLLLAAHRAEADTGASGVLAALDAVKAVSILSWRYADPGRLVADRVGAVGARTTYTSGGGQTPQALLHRTAEEILAGRADCVLIGGAEAWRTRQGARRAGEPLAWTDQGDVTPDEMAGGDLDMNHPDELALGIGMPIQVYPMFDVALRAAEGWSVAEHRARLGFLYARFSEIAADNPNAWNRQAYTAEEVADTSSDNRMVGFPYTKRMNSYEMLDQAAALICCSAEKAEALGIDHDRWVFPHSGAEAKDPYVSLRRSLHESPAMASAGRTALALAGTDVDGVAHFDLYSCFPSAVQLAARAIGIPDGDDRDLTVTGGMSFAGGPWNDYVTHSIAAMVEVLREHPGELGLVSANGGLASKEAFGVYGTTPPAETFRSGSAPPVDELGRTLSTDHDGPVTIETYTVMHDRDGSPALAIAAALTDGGERAWATSDDAEVMAALLDGEEHVGDPAHRSTDGRLSL